MATTQIKNGYHGGNDDQLLVNPDGSINVNSSGGGGTSNVNIVEVGGNTVTTSVPVTDPSIGLTGATAPTSATEMGAVDGSGNLQHLLVDPAGKLLVDISGTSVVTGTVNANIQGLTAFQTSQYTIGITASQLTPTPLTNRSSMSIKSDGNNTSPVYVGNSSGVTTATGYALYPGDSLQLDLTPAQSVYAISSSASQLVYVMEIGS